MPSSIDSMVFKKTGEKKLLKLLLSQGENVHDSILQGMKENSLEDCSIESINGVLKNAVINYLLGNHYKSQDLQNIQILKASGKYELKGEKLWGNLHIVVPIPKPTTVTLVKGIASENLEIVLSFVELK